MAYLSFSPWATEGGAGAYAVATAEDVSRFSALELRVIALAERVDVTGEPSRRSFWGRLAAWAFGLAPDRPLANPKLETLRRFASLARHHPDAVGESEVRALADAGYSMGQAHSLLAYLAPRRSDTRRAGDCLNAVECRTAATKRCNDML